MRLTLLAAAICTLLTGSLLTGCGQKGPLFMPGDDTPPSQQPK